MAKPSRDNIDAGVDKIIAKDTGSIPNPQDELINDLGYDSDTVKVLAPKINKKFFLDAKGLSTGDVIDCDTVDDLVNKINQHPAADFQ